MVVVIMTLAALIGRSASAAEPVFGPGARAGLVPPPGMIVSNEFPGFQDRERQASILVTEMAAQSHERALREFSPDRFKLQGLEEVVREDLALAEGRGLMVAARSATGSPAATRWALLALVKDVTVVLVAVIPDSAKGTYPDAAMRSAFASLIIRPRLPTQDLLALLPYTLSDLAGFRLLTASPDGTAMLTDGPADTPLPVEQPFLLVALRIAPTPQPAEREALARRALGAVVGLENVTITRSEAMRVGPLQGHEIQGESIDQKQGTPLRAVQWVMFGNGAFLQLYGIARGDVWNAVYPRLRAIRDGIRPK